MTTEPPRRSVEPSSTSSEEQRGLAFLAIDEPEGNMPRFMIYRSEEDYQSPTGRNINCELFEGTERMSERHLIAREGGTESFSGYDWGVNSKPAKILARAILRNITEEESQDLKEKVMDCWEVFYSYIIFKKKHEGPFELDSKQVVKFLANECGINQDEFMSLNLD